MGRDPSKFVALVDENLLCLICRKVYDRPVQCPCHVFCYDCATNILRNGGRCPFDGTPLPANFQEQPNIRGIVGNLVTVCDNGCEWRGKWRDLNQHLASECSKTLVNCIYEGCAVLVPRDFHSKHIEVCNFKPKKCGLCSTRLSDEAYAQMKDASKWSDELFEYQNRVCEVAACLTQLALTRTNDVFSWKEQQHRLERLQLEMDQLPATEEIRKRRRLIYQRIDQISKTIDSFVGFVGKR
eukprot:TRINITY_DN5181_c0_g1_i1.p1 TRINITY_DN5181_c0_g1~~TRINITY_DN5181_c0_g1_i1.p1  ORF type:complete len:240 (-),score=23.47 TRINITY_DN5181_c0_g1_i1:56-775(-)